MFANRDFLNANSLDEAKKRLTNELIYAKRKEIFDGEFSHNLNPKNIHVSFLSSKYNDELPFSVTFDKGTVYDASGNLSSREITLKSKIVGIPVPVTKTPVTINSNGEFDNKAIKLNAKTVADAQKLFNSKFVFENRTIIFKGDFVAEIAEADFKVSPKTSARTGAQEYAFTITIAANKTYKADGTINDQALTFNGKITGIAKKTKSHTKPSQNKKPRI